MICIYLKRHCQTLEAFGVSQLESHSCRSYILFWRRSLLNATPRQWSDWVHKPLNSTSYMTVPVSLSLHPSLIFPFHLLLSLVHLTRFCWHSFSGFLASLILLAYNMNKKSRLLQHHEIHWVKSKDLKLKLDKNHDLPIIYTCILYTFTKIWKMVGTTLNCSNFTSTSFTF